VLIEAFLGWQANSLALLADAGHNLSDVMGLVLLAILLRLAYTLRLMR
jgi:Co/Zn/Cd efflux system component